MAKVTSSPQCNLYLSDLLQYGDDLTPFQFKLMAKALNWEWVNGRVPDRQRLTALCGGARNQHDRAQLDELVQVYDTHVLTRRMREQRDEKMAAKQNYSTGQKRRWGGQGSGQGSGQGKELPTGYKPNGINEDEDKTDTNLDSLLSSSSQLPTDVGNCIAAVARAREAAPVDSASGGTLDEEANSHLRDTLAELVRQGTNTVAVHTVAIEKRVNGEVAALVALSATPTALQEFFESRRRTSTLGFVATDFAKWKGDQDAGTTGEKHRAGGGERAVTRTRNQQAADDLAFLASETLGSAIGNSGVD